jgi:hypothetical protein
MSGKSDLCEELRRECRGELEKCIASLCFDIESIIMEYLPRMHCQTLQRPSFSGRYFVTVDHLHEMKESDVATNFLQQIAQHTSTQTFHWMGLSCIVYRHSKRRVFVLINGGGYDRFVDSCGLLQEPNNLALQTVLRSGFTLSFDLDNVAVTELTDKDFAQQWIHYVGCHAYQKYPEYSIVSILDGQVEVGCVGETSYFTYIAKYWKQYREKHGCFSSSCMKHAAHHWCRERNLSSCVFLRECQCNCETCDPNLGGPHSCSTPSAMLCFVNWNPDK